MYVKPMGLCYSLFLLRMFFNLASPAECIFPELLFFFLGYTYATAPKKLDIKTFGVPSSAENFRGACVSRLCVFMTLLWGANGTSSTYFPSKNSKYYFHILAFLEGFVIFVHIIY